MDLAAAFPYRVFISLPSRADRRRTLLPRLAAAGITAEWLPAVQGKKLRHAYSYANSSRRAISMSIRCALAEAERREASAVLIMEDDVTFHPNFAERVANLTLPEDWGMFYFGCCHAETPAVVGGGLVRTARSFDSHAFAVRRPYYRILRERLATRTHKFPKFCDVRISDLHKLIPTYACFPNLAWQAFGRSDLADLSTYSNYESDGSQKLFPGAVAPLLAA